MIRNDPPPPPESAGRAFAITFVTVAATALATKVVDWAWAKLTDEKPKTEIKPATDYRPEKDRA